MPRPDAALRRLRRQRARSALSRTGAVLCALLLVVALVGGSQAATADQRLIDTQVRHPATVVAVTRVQSGRIESYDVDVVVEGRRARLSQEPAHASTARPGDVLDVVIDPADPSYVLPTTAHDDWVYTATGTLVVEVGTAVLFLLFIRSLTAPAMPLSLFRAARRARTASWGQVLAVHDATLTIETEGTQWLWSRRRSRGWMPEIGDSIVLLGTVRPGALVFLDDGRTRRPGAPLVAEPHEAGAEARDAGDSGVDASRT